VCLWKIFKEFECTLRMEDQSVNKMHIRHLMLYEFRESNNATNVINSVCPSALDIKIDFVEKT